MQLPVLPTALPQFPYDLQHFRCARVGICYKTQYNYPGRHQFITNYNALGPGTWVIVVLLKTYLLILSFSIPNNDPTTVPETIVIHNESVTGRVLVLGFATTTRPGKAKLLQLLMNPPQAG